jgi:hypothetical protein
MRKARMMYCHAYARLSVDWYSMFESDIPLCEQDRTRRSHFAWDITAKISSYLSGSWTHGRYKGEEAVINDQTVNADEGWRTFTN